MRIRTRYTGRSAPFERLRRLVLRRLPAGAVISRAVLTVTPHSVDPGRRFLETIEFRGPIGDWGANKALPAGAVEIDLHARRKLAALTGTSLNSTQPDGVLLVDLGGGFLGVNDSGGLGAGPALKLSDSMDLPGLTVTGLRIAKPSADISALKVVSPPTDITLAVEGGPVFYNRTGDLVQPVTTPDFSALLQGMLLELPVENGCHVVPFIVTSNSISRLDLDLEVDYTVAVSATPDDLTTIQSSYQYAGTPTAVAALSIAMAPGLIAVPGGTAGRVQGGFEASTVVFGALTPATTEHVEVSAAGPLAQPFTLIAAEVASSIDLLVTSVTAEAKLAIDVVNDLDGKPGRVSSLSKPAELTLTRDTAGSPTWLNVVLPAELELPGGVRHWLVVQAKEGVATWGAAAAAAADGAPARALQKTTDGGLSWRVVGSGVEAHLRLRQVTSTFQMPLELRVAAGTEEVAVSLQRFAAQGSIDLDLSLPEVAGAVNTAVAGQSQAQVTAEHVANGTFADWYRVGTEIGGPLALGGANQRQSLGRAAAFLPDSGTVLLGAQGAAGARLQSYDVFTRLPGFNSALGSAGFPVAMAVDPSGAQVVVALTEDSGRVPGAFLQLASTANGQPIGPAIAVPEQVLDVVRVADGSGVLLLCRDDSNEAVVRFVSWVDLRAGTPNWSELPSDRMIGIPRALATGADGAIYLLLRGDGKATVVRYPDRSGLLARNAQSVELIDGGIDLAVVSSRSQVIFLGQQTVQFLRANDLTMVSKFDLPAGSSPQCLGVDPADELGLVIQDGAVLAIDVRRRALIVQPGAVMDNTSDGAEIVVSPAGTHAVVTLEDGSSAQLLTLGNAQPVDWELTAGDVRPFAFPATGEVFALLGDLNRRESKVPRPAAISQAVGVLADTRYRFAFDGISQDEDAVAQLIWRGSACSRGRTDRVPITSFNADRETALDHIPRHEVVVTSPPGASQVEIRIFTPGGLTAVDRITLAGTADAVSTLPSSWTPSGAVVAPSGGTGITMTNSGATDALVTQLVPVDQADVFDLRLTARVDGPAAAMELTFGDETEAPIGAALTLPLDPLDFEDRAMNGTVPAGSAVARLRFVVPAGGAVELSALTLTCGTAQQVALQFVSQAPGDLTMTGVSVQLDEGLPVASPLPADGLCPSTPVGDGPDGEQCYCSTCGEDRPVRRPVAVLTPAGRPASLTSCPTCGTDRLRLGGQLRMAPEIHLPRFRIPDRQALTTGPAVVSRVRTDLPVTAVRGIGAARAVELSAVGVPDLVALSSASPQIVARLRGVSDQLARRLIVEAGQLVRAHGVRVIFPT
ncbi:helix-hairpin-helix domain-containing protein [Kribbella catacumbae]|uniref:helix-hairpin-helix domain-containing protein n=1 Tax=Kribbella catacumbae TaxID=460086 RepID=UPI000365FF15|nr:helix-hairpin-helix domain-containing protein [Kribbella catacumbae]